MSSKSPKLHVHCGDANSVASDPRSDARAEMKGESLLSKSEIVMIEEFRGRIATIPTLSEIDCLEALNRFEGPDNVLYKFVERSILVRDQRELFAKENTKEGFVPVKDYLKRLFETRIEKIFREPRATWDKINP